MTGIKHVNLFPSGRIQMPPSKSAAHRAIICAGLAKGESLLENVSLSGDIAATAECMRGFGAKIGYDSDNRGMAVSGSDIVEMTDNSRRFDCGESGSTLRFLLPIAAMLPFDSVFTGRGRLMSRPIEPFLNALVNCGAAVSLTDGELTVSGSITPGEYLLPGDISSQFVSGLLMSLPLLRGDSEIILTTPLQSSGYVELTLEIMSAFGVNIGYTGMNRFYVPGGQSYTPRRFRIEGDYSNAAFFLAASALGAECECLGLSLDSKQGDRKILDILKDIGADLTYGDSGGVITRAGKLNTQKINISDIPDLLPPLAVLAAVSEGTSRFEGAERLRYKESDRLETVSAVLKSLGADISVFGGVMTVKGKPSLRGGTVSSFGDHRIAMMSAVAAIRCAGGVSIDDPDCVKKSYPEFWKDFEKVSKSELTFN